MSNRRILLVENDAVVRMDLVKSLKQQNYEVLVCSRAEEALAIILGKRVGLMITDIILAGEMDGIELARYAKEHYKIPVIFLTGLYDELVVARAKQVRPEGYFLKPYVKEHLMTTIGRIIPPPSSSETKRSNRNGRTDK